MNALPRSSLEGSTPLFPAAPHGESVAAALRFVESLLELGSRFESQSSTLEAALALLSRCQRGEIRLDLRRAIRHVVALADHVLLDEIRPSFRRGYPWTDPAAVYQRYRVYDEWIPPLVRDEIAGRCGPFGNLIVAFPEQIALAERAVAGARIGLLTPDLGYWIDHTKPGPPWGVPRQVLFTSLLACGKNPLEGARRDPDATLSAAPLPRHLVRSRRLARLALRVEDAALGKLVERTARHWGAILREGKGPEVEKAILFSSGVAANESVILSLSRRAEAKAYVDSNWYFENRASIEQRFRGRLLDSPREASAFFVNLEPITYCTLLDQGAPSEDVPALLGTIREVAERSPTRPVFLVLDVTSNTAFDLSELLKAAFPGASSPSAPLPPNLVLYKTVSVTKHQKGSRNWFAGAVSIHGSSPEERKILRRDLEDAKVWTGGLLHPLHVLNLPRPSGPWIDRTRETIRGLNRSVAEALGPTLRKRFVAYTYHSFLLPSASAVAQLTSNVLAMALDGGLDAREEFRLRAGRLLGERDLELSGRLSEIGFGNSFALPESRLIDQECAKVDICPGLSVRCCVYRLAPGYAASAARLVDETRIALDFLEETFGRLAELAAEIRCRASLAWTLRVASPPGPA